METVNRNYALPEAVVERLEQVSQRTGVSLQRLVAAGIFMVTELGGDARDEVMMRVDKLVAEVEDNAGLTSSQVGPPKHVAPVKAGETLAARERAVHRTVEQEAAAKLAKRKSG